MMVQNRTQRDTLRAIKDQAGIDSKALGAKVGHGVDGGDYARALVGQLRKKGYVIKSGKSKGYTLIGTPSV